jgi:phage tail tape-measure protein
MSMAIARRLKQGDSGGGGLGNIIGTALGAVLGSVIPGAGTLAGASIGGALGGTAGGVVDKPKAPTSEPGAMERRSMAQAPAPQPESMSPILEESLMALKEIPDEFREKYTEPLVRAYSLSFKQDKQRGLA